MDKELSDFLNEDEVVDEVVQEEAADDRPRDEQGRFAPKGVEESAPPAPVNELPQDVYEPLKAVRGENQQLKARLAEYERQMQAIQNPPAPPPDVFEDTDGFRQHVTTDAASVATERAIYASKLQTSQMLLMQEVPNLSEIKEELMEFVGSNPAINEQVATSEHPWRTAYQAFKNYQTMQELGATDVDSLREQIRQEELAKLQSQRPTLPPSLANERSVGQRSGPAWTGPSALEDILR